MSTTVSPVTHEAETAVKQAVSNAAPCPSCVAQGVIKRSVPVPIRKAKLSTMIWNDESRCSKEKIFMELLQHIKTGSIKDAACRLFLVRMKGLEPIRPAALDLNPSASASSAASAYSFRRGPWTGRRVLL